MAQLKSTVVYGSLAVTGSLTTGGKEVLTEHQSLDGYVPTSRTINSKALTSNISLTASDVGAAASNHNHDSSYVAKNNAITGATKCKITYDSKGLVTSGADLTSSDIPALSYAGLASGASSGGKAASAAVADSGWPTKLSGFTDDLGSSPTHTHSQYLTTYTDTKNTTGGDDTSSKIFLVGMTAQTTSNGNSRTYTQDTAYVGTDGCLYSNSTKVSVEGHTHSYVPTTRTVNSKALSADISLTAADVGAAAANHGNHVPALETADNSKFLRNDNTWQKVTPANIGAATSSHNHAGVYAPVATTLSGYGITDAKIANGVITLGSNTITPVTDVSGKVSGPASATSGNIVLFDGTTGKLVKNSSYSPSSFAASDHNHNTVYLGINAKASSAGSADAVAWSGVTNTPTTLAGYGITDAAGSGHTHTTSIATTTDTNQITLSANTKYKLTAGDTSYVFTTPADNNTTNTAGTNSFIEEYSDDDPMYLVGARYYDDGVQTTYTMSGVYARDGYLYSDGEKCWTSDNHDTLTDVYCTATSSSNYNYPILMKYSNATTSVSAGARFMSTVYINGSSGRITAPSFNASSALKSKENISDATLDAVKLINSTKIVNFTFKHDEAHTPKIGFIADYTDSLLATPDHDTMDMYNCIGVLMKAVQELSKEIEELKKNKPE